MDWAADRNISVLLDVHAVRDSQNGFDNGGRVWQLEWDETGTKFNHHDIAAGEWLGDWDFETA